MAKNLFFGTIIKLINIKLINDLWGTGGPRGGVGKRPYSSHFFGHFPQGKLYIPTKRDIFQMPKQQTWQLAGVVESQVGQRHSSPRGFASLELAPHPSSNHY